MCNGIIIAPKMTAVAIGGQITVQDIEFKLTYFIMFVCLHRIIIFKDWTRFNQNWDKHPRIEFPEGVRK